MEIEGYNMWMEYPEEIDKGALIKFGDGMITVMDTRDIGHGLWQVTFEERSATEPAIHGAFTIYTDAKIQTFTKFVPKD